MCSCCWTRTSRGTTRGERGNPAGPPARALWRPSSPTAAPARRCARARPSQLRPRSLPACRTASAKGQSVGLHDVMRLRDCLSWNRAACCAAMRARSACSAPAYSGALTRCAGGAPAACRPGAGRCSGSYRAAAVRRSSRRRGSGRTRARGQRCGHVCGAQRGQACRCRACSGARMAPPC
jgi:hypothetical protein